MNGLWEILDWRWFGSLLDVVLVYYLIYRLLLFVRGTRAEPMLLGLGIIALVYVLSRQLNLGTLNWILGNFLGSVILVVVVLFQDELRRALTKVGLFPGLGSVAPEALDHTIREISRAAGELSVKRIGALIVIRRDVGLEEYIEHAVQLNADISHQLLISVFQPTSPLHDGAVVVEGERVMAAGAVLPLSFSQSDSSHSISGLGTRHRAALGLSERTDALIVIVSEETGRISLVRESRMTRDLNERTLYNALHRLTVFRQQKVARRRERRRNFISRIFSSARNTLADTTTVEEVEASPTSTTRIIAEVVEPRRGEAELAKVKE